LAVWTLVEVMFFLLRATRSDSRTPLGSLPASLWWLLPSSFGLSIRLFGAQCQSRIKNFRALGQCLWTKPSHLGYWTAAWWLC
jgi:hypothetical protein